MSSANPATTDLAEEFMERRTTLQRIQGEVGFSSIQYDDQIGKLYG